MHHDRLTESGFQELFFFRAESSGPTESEAKDKGAEEGLAATRSRSRVQKLRAL